MLKVMVTLLEAHSARRLLLASQTVYRRGSSSGGNIGAGGDHELRMVVLMTGGGLHGRLMYYRAFQTKLFDVVALDLGDIN